VKTGRPRPLPDGAWASNLFSPDGRTLAVAAVEPEHSHTRALKLLDVTDGREKWSVPVTDKAGQVYFSDFSPDGRLLAGSYRVFPQPGQWDRWDGWLKVWDAATGREVASFPAEKGDAFSGVRFSPDGRTLAAVNWRMPGPEQGQARKLFLLRPDDGQPPRTVALGEKLKKQLPVATKPVFSPDGKWIVVITQPMPERDGDEPDPRDVPQARIHLIDVASAEVREALVAPPGFPRAACFSPDSKTLATGGYGRVLLWDVSDLPATRDQPQKR
jgi:WD40 repeat protein